VVMEFYLLSIASSVLAIIVLVVFGELEKIIFKDR